MTESDDSEGPQGDRARRGRALSARTHRQSDDEVAGVLDERIASATTPEEARQWTLVRALNAKIARDDNASRAENFETRAIAAFPYFRLGLAVILGSALFAFGYVPAALMIFGIGFSPDIVKFLAQLKDFSGRGGGGSDA